MYKHMKYLILLPVLFLSSCAQDAGQMTTSYSHLNGMSVEALAAKIGKPGRLVTTSGINFYIWENSDEIYNTVPVTTEVSDGVGMDTTMDVIITEDRACRLVAQVDKNNKVVDTRIDGDDIACQYFSGLNNMKKN